MAIRRLCFLRSLNILTRKAPLTALRMRIALGLKSGQSGIRIRRVEPASPASKAQTKFEVYMVLWCFFVL